MEAIVQQIMNINWVIADGYQIDPTVDLDILKSIGPIWGSWTTWRACGTDNVVCQNQSKAQELIKRDFQNLCNFYTSSQFQQALNRPTNVKFYGGEFNQELDSIEDIISLHLAGNSGEIVLMMGFNFPPIAKLADRFELHKLKNRYGLVRSLITSKTDTQFVMIDHPKQMEKTYQTISNLTCDTLGNVLQLLAQ